LNSGAAEAPRVYLVTDRQQMGDGPGVVERVRRALHALERGAADGDAGALRPQQVAIQLREKDLGGRALLELARALRAVTAAAGAALYVNDRVDVALAVAADGVHLGGGALSPAEVGALAPGLRIGLATHSVAEVVRAAADPHVTFVVFGPIFDSPAKRALGRAPVGLDALRLAATSPIPVLALGGVDPGSAAACAAAGAHGVAGIRFVLGAEDPARALGEIWSAWCGKSRLPS
jgi:thiamine-phosphate pyrophosphorylase